MIDLSKVVLPTPLRPITTVQEPWGIESSTSLSVWLSP
jgi:hypothetical protein